jgi:hypothetical protein
MANLRQTRSYESEWWTIDLLDDWTATEDPECTTFRARIPVGALQVSAARKPKDDATLEDLKEFAGGLEPPKLSSPFANGEISGLSAEFEQSGFYSRHWWLRKGPVVVFVTYNVALSNRADEQQMIDDLVHSLKIVT